jgi:uncharacterized protein (DUF302 family)
MPRFAGLRRVAALATLAWATPYAAAPAAEPPAIYERTTQKPLVQVVEDAEFAIVERNFRITGKLHIGKGIRERDGDDFPDHEVILFCNLGYAREMLQLDPGYINFCPGRIAIRADAAGVVVSAPLLPENTGNTRLGTLVTKLNTLIREIVDYAAESWIEESK